MYLMIFSTLQDFIGMHVSHKLFQYFLPRTLQVVESPLAVLVSKLISMRTHLIDQPLTSPMLAAPGGQPEIITRRLGKSPQEPHYLWVPDVSLKMLVCFFVNLVFGFCLSSLMHEFPKIANRSNLIPIENQEFEINFLIILHLLTLNWGSDSNDRQLLVLSILYYTYNYYE